MKIIKKLLDDTIKLKDLAPKTTFTFRKEDVGPCLVVEPHETDSDGVYYVCLQSCVLYPPAQHEQEFPVDVIESEFIYWE